MKPGILLTRPLEAARRSAARLDAAGFESVVAPVTRIVPSDAPCPAGSFDAILVTSVHAVPALAARHASFARHRVFAVGSRSAAALREAGFVDIETASGTAESLGDLVAARLQPGARILHAAGRDRKSEPAAALATAGFPVEPWTVYAAVAVATLPQAAIEALAGERLAYAVHYSRRTLEILIGLADKARLAERLLSLRHACLSQEIAQALESAGGAMVMVAAWSAEDALLEALDRLRQAGGEAGSPAPQSRC